MDLVNLCAGVGKCGKCVVHIMEGRVNHPTAIEKNILAPEQIAKGYRLACETSPMSDLKVAVPPESLTTPQRAQVESIEMPVVPEPLIKFYNVKLSPSNSDDLRSDYRRIADEISERFDTKNVSIPLKILQELPSYFRKNVREVGVVIREKEIIGLVDGNTAPLGLAVDIGTTKIAAYLVDLHTGETLARKGEINPQVNYGEDVIARFVYAQSSREKAYRLHRILIETLNKMLADLCNRAGVSPIDVFDIVIVCNTAIHHLFLQLSTESLSRAPYIPVMDSEMDVKASELGLKAAPNSYVHLLPNIAGYVGADHVAMLLGVDILHREGVCLAIDIGTNTEICLSKQGHLSSLSCASGPAFEGAHIKFGMRAADGAIERLKIENDKIRYQTIGGKPARGICGSGILDVFAEMYRVGALGKNGRMNAEHPLIIDNNGHKEIVLSEKEQDNSIISNITFSQKDVREIQLAKGAIRTGIEVLLKAHDLKTEAIDEIIIAGAFGTYIDVESAKTVGMLPNIPSGRFVQVGNAAGLGSRLALISRKKREEAIRISRKVNYIELGSFPDFSTMFAEALYLGQL